MVRSGDGSNSTITMKRHITILSIFAAAISVAIAETPATTPTSQPQKSRAEEFFKKLDTDSDGALSSEEFKTGLSAQTNSAAVEEYFNKLDSNGDGSVSLAEYTSHNKPTEPASPAAAPEKLPPPLPKLPVVTEPPRSTEPHKNTEPPQHQPPAPSVPHVNPTPTGAESYFKKMDANDDGGISFLEFKAGPAGQNNPRMAEEYFKKLDQNGDGKITMEEFTAHGKPASSTPHQSYPPKSPYREIHRRK